MKVIGEKLGETTIYIQTLDDVSIIGETGLVPTGISDDLKKAYSNAKSAIKAIATDFGNDLKSLDADARPKQVEMEISLGISVEGKVFLLSGKGEYGLNVKLIWKFD